MTTSQYNAVAERTRAVIAKKGADVVFVDLDEGSGAYNPLTDTWSGGPTATAVTGAAVEVPGDPDRFAALGLVLANPVVLLVAATGLEITPAPGMAFTWGGVTYTIKNVEKVAPDGVTVVLWTLIGSA